MIIIKTIQTFFWHNIYAAHPVIFTEIGFAQGKECNSITLPENVRQTLIKRFPVLNRLKEDSLAESLVNICFFMQQEKFNLPVVKKVKGMHFYFAAIDFHYATTIVIETVKFLNKVIANPGLSTKDINVLLDIFEDKTERSALDQSVRAMVMEGQKRDIPWLRVSSGIRDVQFGQGHLQRRMRETIPCTESAIATSYARDKALTCYILNSIGLPAGKYASVLVPEHASARAQEIGFPVVLKPTSAGKGKDVVVGLNTPEEVYNTAKKILTKWPQLLVQSLFKGDDYRLLVVEGKFIAAARREPASVIADGKHTIGQLIEIANSNPRRGRNFYRLMNTIIIDDEVRRTIHKQGFSLDSIPPSGVKVPVRLAANISGGGISTDFTDIIHPDNKRLAVRAALACGLQVAGIDFMTPDISKSWHQVGGGICEVNSGIDARPHLIANPNHDIIKPIFNTIFKEGESGRIPVAMIAGGKDASLTIKILNNILQATGYITGCATSSAITIDNEIIKEGDYANVAGSALIMRDPTTTAAILEVSESSIKDKGIYLDYCNIAAVTGIENKNTKNLYQKLINAAKDKIVLNADDKHCIDIAKKLPIDKLILFSANPSAEYIQSYISAKGTAIILQKNKILIYINGKANELAKLKDNADECAVLAATATAYALAIPAKIISKAII